MSKLMDEARIVLSPGLRDAAVLDRMCSRFVLSLTMRQPGRFNLRRDWNSLLSLTGRHLVWPIPVLRRLREFLALRCRNNDAWRGHEGLGDEAFIVRYGAWQGPYEEGTLFFYIDEFIKDAPKDLLAVLGATANWLNRSLKKESTRVEKNIDALASLLQLNPAERALLFMARWRATSVICAACWSSSRCRTRRRLMRRSLRWPASTSPRWPRPCAPARGSSASAWSRT